MTRLSCEGAEKVLGPRRPSEIAFDGSRLEHHDTRERGTLCPAPGVYHETGIPRAAATVPTRPLPAASRRSRDASPVGPSRLYTGRCLVGVAVRDRCRTRAPPGRLSRGDTPQRAVGSKAGARSGAAEIGSGAFRAAKVTKSGQDAGKERGREGGGGPRIAGAADRGRTRGGMGSADNCGIGKTYPRIGVSQESEGDGRRRARRLRAAGNRHGRCPAGVAGAALFRTGRARPGPEVR